MSAEYKISRRIDPIIPSRVDCPLCKKDHRVRQEGLMHFFVCKKNNGARFFVGWNDVYMVQPPRETTFVNREYK